MESDFEAKIIGKYLINKNINNQAVTLYRNAMKLYNFQPGIKDQRIQSFAFRYPFFIGLLDGGMALTLKQSVLRKKIFLMLAILETIPEYSDSYLSKKQSLVEFFKLIFFGIRGIFRGVLGLLLLKIL